MLDCTFFLTSHYLDLWWRCSLLTRQVYELRLRSEALSAAGCPPIRARIRRELKIITCWRWRRDRCRRTHVTLFADGLRRWDVDVGCSAGMRYVVWVQHSAAAVRHPANVWRGTIARCASVVGGLLRATVGGVHQRRRNGISKVAQQVCSRSILESWATLFRQIWAQRKVMFCFIIHHIHCKTHP